MKPEKIGKMQNAQDAAPPVQFDPLRRPKGRRTEKKPGVRGAAQADLVEQVLRSEGGSSHIELIRKQVQELFGVRLQVDSIASALRDRQPRPRAK